MIDGARTRCDWIRDCRPHHFLGEVIRTAQSFSLSRRCHPFCDQGSATPRPASAPTFSAALNRPIRCSDRRVRGLSSAGCTPHFTGTLPAPAQTGLRTSLTSRQKDVTSSYETSKRSRLGVRLPRCRYGQRRGNLLGRAWIGNDSAGLQQLLDLLAGCGDSPGERIPGQPSLSRAPPSVPQEVQPPRRDDGGCPTH